MSGEVSWLASSALGGPLATQSRDSCSFKLIRSVGRSVFVSVPTAYILGSPDLHVDKGSTINLTCSVRHSYEPPAYIFWFHQDEVSEYTRGGGVLERHLLALHSLFTTRHSCPQWGWWWWDCWSCSCWWWIRGSLSSEFPRPRLFSTCIMLIRGKSPLCVRSRGSQGSHSTQRPRVFGIYFGSALFRGGGWSCALVVVEQTFLKQNSQINLNYVPLGRVSLKRQVGVPQNELLSPDIRNLYL